MRLTKLFFTLATLLALTACGGDSDSAKALITPNFVGASIENGAKDIGTGNFDIIFTFDNNVKLAANAKSNISINNATINYIQASFKKVTVSLKGLQKGKTYKLNIPKGTILGDAGTEVAAIIWSFSTVSGEENVPIKAKLCTDNPMPQAQKVFNYLYETYGEKTLSCTIANVNWNTAEADLVYNATGKYPAMNCFDYIHLPYSPANWIDYTNTKVAEDWWNAGGLVAACWHWNVPLSETNTQNHTCTPSETTFRAKNIFVEGSWEQKTADADLEKMADMLLLLQDKGIPVIWRPLHEAAGNIYEYNGGTAWFWWGYDGAEVYVKLWRYMFDYFKAKGVNNLIWVWTTQEKDAPFYPGDDYVDIIGRDLYGADYNNEKDAAQNASHFSAIQQNYSHKLITLSECGSVGKISQQWSAGAHWSWFMPWYQYNASTLEGHQHADTNWWKDAMSQDFVVTRDQLPSFK